jgi:hypothetical protein
MAGITDEFVVVDSFEEDLVDLPLVDLVFFAVFEGICEQVPDQLHELVDAVVVDQIPFLMQVKEHGSQEDECVLLGQFEEQFGDAGVEVVLVDHLVEVPQPEEQRFDDVGQHRLVERA